MSDHSVTSLQSRWAQVDGWRMHARVATEGAPAGRLPVVLVHGLVVSSRYMVPAADRLAPHFPVYAPDLPGFGRSEGPRRWQWVPDLADALARWMEAVGVESAAVLANSFGCQVAADLAVRYPARVERLVLVGPTLDPHQRNLLRLIPRWLKDSIEEPISMKPIQLRDYADAGPLRAVGAFAAMLQDHIEEKLPRVQVPTLVARGSHDSLATQRWAEEMARLLPQGRLVVIPGAPHAANFAAPDKLVEVVVPFLAEARVGQRVVA